MSESVLRFAAGPESIHPTPNLFGDGALEIAQIEMAHRQIELADVALVPLGQWSHCRENGFD